MQDFWNPRHYRGKKRDAAVLPLRWLCQVDFSLVRGSTISITSIISSALIRTDNPVWIAPRAFFLLALLPLFFASCSVLFVSPYDEVTDRAATELVAKTEIFIVRYAATTDETGHVLRRGKPYDAEAATFYTEARGTAAAMLLRSEQEDKNEEEIQILRNLSTRYDQLEASHRLGPITKTSAAGLHRTLRSLVQVQLTKKHIATSKETTSAPASNP